MREDWHGACARMTSKIVKPSTFYFLGLEVDRSPPSSTEVRITWSYTFTPPIRLNGLVFS